MEESGSTDGSVRKEFYSKLVKADEHGKDQVYKALYFLYIPVNGTIIYLFKLCRFVEKHDMWLFTRFVILQTIYFPSNLGN